MKKFIIGGILTVVIMALPTIASAHTGTVTCDSRGVVFSYNNNFQNPTVSTEFVKDSTQGNGNQFQVTVPAHNAFTHIVAVTAPVVVASASWTDGHSKGGIGPVTLNCPQPPKVTPPPTIIPPACPTNTVSEGMSNGVLVCVRTITNTVQLPAPPANTVTVTVTAPIVALKCPKGTKVYRRYSSGVICTKRHVVVKHSVKLIPYKPVGPPKKNHGVGGVAG